MQYICGKFKPELLGTTLQEKAKVYQMQNVINEAFLKGCMMPFFASDDKNVHIENMTKNLAPLVTHLDSKTYLLGDNLTMVDF